MAQTISMILLHDYDEDQHLYTDQHLLKFYPQRPDGTREDSRFTLDDYLREIDQSLETRGTHAEDLPDKSLIQVREMKLGKGGFVTDPGELFHEDFGSLGSLSSFWAYPMQPDQFPEDKLPNVIVELNAKTLKEELLQNFSPRVHLWVDIPDQGAKLAGEYVPEDFNKDDISGYAETAAFSPEYRDKEGFIQATEVLYSADTVLFTDQGDPINGIGMNWSEELGERTQFERAVETWSLDDIRKQAREQKHQIHLAESIKAGQERYDAHKGGTAPERERPGTERNPD